ncbi:uncharacterized protein [Elaeis guineensis]|uniref:uncharacterized protein isoform X4 n=1 Tax=Elaeis guineensis var. tenera TaxID=51953 RepID=UPI003C6D85B5
MENMQYAEELLREFLIFRGFTNTLQAFERELSTDIGRSFQVDKVLDLIFSVYIPKYQADKLISLLNFFKQCFSSPSEVLLISTLSKLEVSILRYYIVHALQSGRQDKVVEFFGANGNYLLQKREDWMPWFGGSQFSFSFFLLSLSSSLLLSLRSCLAAIPYVKNPNLDPQFHVYFSKEWFDALLLSFRNFLSEIFNGTRIPALLKISTEKNTVKHLKNDIKQLNHKLSQLQALLETKEAEIFRLRNMSPAAQDSSMLQDTSSISDLSSENSSKDNGGNPRIKDFSEANTTVPSHLGERILGPNDVDSSGSSNVPQESKSELVSSSLGQPPFGNDEARDDLQISQAVAADSKRDMLREDEFPEIKVDFQETFLGHTSPISRCRFSASGTNIASASMDGTVRIWTYDSSTPTSRNATIYCGAEIMSLDWECRSDRLLLVGTADGGIKAWNVDAKRVVCDLSTTTEFPSVLDLKCSPVEPIFVSAAASRRHGSNKLDKVGFASLTVWNMKMWKAMTVLPLGEDPPAITSLCFNHNGKILAASAIDGMIHMFGILI